MLGSNKHKATGLPIITENAICILSERRDADRDEKCNVPPIDVAGAIRIGLIGWGLG